MTYSASDFSDDIFAELHRVGAITAAEANGEDLDDNANLQSDYALAGIARLTECKDALDHLRRAIAAFANHRGISLQDGVFCEADERAARALRAIETRDPSEADVEAARTEPRADAVRQHRECLAEGEVQPGATRAEIVAVMMQDLVGDYDVPDQVHEWAWVERNASFSHVNNGESGGVWEFVLNLGKEWDDIPEKLVPAIKQARENGIAYLIFHQGT